METLTEMIKRVTRAKEDYYKTGRSELSDAEYDRLVEQAEKLGYVETVGATPVDNIEKITHEHPMLSLDKCHTIDEVGKFCGDKVCIAMWKADGLTISATYIDGVLSRLETRGNGEVGNDIMFHANSIENLPKHINKNGKYVIDGECVILEKDFKAINSKITKSEQYSNSRNLAAGSLNLLDADISKKRHLRFYAWDVIDGERGDCLSENLLEARTLGFNTVNYDIFGGKYNMWGSSEEDVKYTIDVLRSNALAEGFPIDGIVIKFNDIKFGKSLGMTGHHPKNAIAYKFKDDTYPTKLKSVEWQVGKTGQVTPVANVDPVDCDGVIVEKASLHNISIMKSFGLTNGCTCYIKRANDVIPQIESADNDGNGEIEIPTTCPICGHSTEIRKDKDSEILYCTNDDCPGKLLGKWKTFVSKKGMDVDGLSEATLDTFLKRGYLDNMFVNLYSLQDYKKELYKIDGFGKKSIDNLIDAIERSKNVDLVHFLCAFSIPNIGEGQSKLIAKKFPTFAEFADACDNDFDFSQIDGIGKILNLNIHQWWVNNHYQMIDVANEVNFKTANFMNTPTGNYPLAGKNFVVTGSVSHFKNRTELQNKIEELGGKVVGSVSKNTDYLINNDTESLSSKNKKAKDLGIPIISEKDFLHMIDSNCIV